MKISHAIEDLENTICPMTFATPEIPATRRSGPFPCVGPNCMAWRFVRTHVQGDKYDNLISSDDTHGYCGMAGTP